jgi:hypothetical protein
VNVADSSPFASLGGLALTPAYAEAGPPPDHLHELRACPAGLLLPGQRPVHLGSIGHRRAVLVNVSDFIQNKVLGRRRSSPATTTSTKQRTFGVVHFEQDPPVFSDLADTGGLRQGAGGRPRSPRRTCSTGQDARTGHHDHRQDEGRGVTTIVFSATRSCRSTSPSRRPRRTTTRVDRHGTVLTDTTVLGRMYDQSQ